MPTHSPHLTRRQPLWLAASALLFAALSLSSPPLRADSDHELARQALEKGQVLPLRSVLDRVEREYQGQAIKVEFEHDDGIFIYEIRLLQAGGRVIKLEVDARDGRVLKLKRKD
ncbi:PepSY domain-containing protein [Comamonas composti]|uniref:PepSY domain-containing protein n=1 Tax=Comamonas composti TaxID=408558 RepID=UPI00041FCED0|nr:PepSY domain-containing protein [Comamonas composti]